MSRVDEKTPPIVAVSGSNCRWYRQLVVLLALAPLAFLFTMTRHEPFSVGLLGLGFADAAVLLLCLTMAIGPAVRLKPGLYRLLDWRRQMGIGVAVASTLHVAAFAWGDILALPGQVLEAKDGRVFLQADLGAAVSWVGIVAFCYILALALTSNDYSQRLLKAGWRRLHGQGSTLFALSAVHVLLAVYLIAEANSKVFLPLLWLGLALTVTLQIADFTGSFLGRKKTEA